MKEIEFYFKEDFAEIGDITSENLFSDENGKGIIKNNEECILAGVKEIEFIFQKLGGRTTNYYDNGEFIEKNENIFEINGPIISILKGERLALNMIGRMSAIATETKKIVDKCTQINPKIEIAATRKTTPGFRKYEKKAVEIGGGISHRMGLYDAVMIKDNHIKSIGSIEKAVDKINKKNLGKTIEIEVENSKDAIIVADMNVDVIMLDNFDSKNAEITTKKVKEINPNIIIEISGGITPENILEYAGFADRISLGYLTHSIKNIDFSLEII